jgi:hypothetical protein
MSNRQTRENWLAVTSVTATPPAPRYAANFRRQRTGQAVPANPRQEPSPSTANWGVAWQISLRTSATTDTRPRGRRTPFEPDQLVNIRNRAQETAHGGIYPDVAGHRSRGRRRNTPQSVSSTVAGSPAADRSRGPNGPASPTVASEHKNYPIPVVRSTVSGSLARTKTMPIAGNGKAHHRQRPKNMPTTEPISARAELSTADRTDLTCAVCPHEWDAHDPIGIRFCSATVAGQLHRGCVCVGNNCNENRR